MIKKIMLSGICILLIAIIVVSIIGFSPVKKAVNKEAINYNKTFIIVKAQRSTISEWTVLEDNEGIIANEADVKLTGNIPSGYNYEFEIGQNQFLCYGRYMGMESQYPVSLEEIMIFEVDSWEILFPIKRESLIPFLPKNYLCKFDVW